MGPAEFMKQFGFQGLTNGGSVTRKISGDRLVKISLSENNGETCPTRGHYVSLKVEVVNTKTGPVDSSLFLFDNFLRVRKDDRKDYPGRCGGRAFQVISSCGWKWYIAEPKSVEPLVHAVNEYVGFFLTFGEQE